MLTQRSLSLNAEAGFSHEGTDPYSLTVIISQWTYPTPVDKILSSRRGLFKGLRTDATEVAVASVTVVEHFNVIEDIRPGHVPGFVYPLPDALFFQ